MMYDDWKETGRVLLLKKDGTPLLISGSRSDGVSSSRSPLLSSSGLPLQKTDGADRENDPLSLDENDDDIFAIFDDDSDPLSRDGSTPVKGRRGAVPEDQVWHENHPAFTRYILPENLTLKSMFSLARMAKIINVASGRLSRNFNESGLIPYAPQPGEPKNTVNIQMWQVLALVEMGKLKLSPNSGIYLRNDADPSDESTT
jgi:hypothetical protein